MRTTPEAVLSRPWRGVRPPGLRAPACTTTTRLRAQPSGTVYDNVLVATDASPASEAAIEHGVHVAAGDDATVHAVHVVEMTDLGDVTMDVAQDPESDIEPILEPVHQAASDAGLESEEAILQGRPHEQIADYVDREGIDLVVVGTHGKTGVSRVLLGSTAEKIVRHVGAPVLAVAPDEAESRSESVTAAEADGETGTGTDGEADAETGARL